MLNKICKQKPDENVERVVKVQYNKNDDNRNMACKCLLIVSFVSIIDYFI